MVHGCTERIVDTGPDVAPDFASAPWAGRAHGRKLAVDVAGRRWFVFLTDLGVPDVGEVRDLRASRRPSTFLTSTKVPILAARFRPSVPGPEVRETGQSRRRRRSEHRPGERWKGWIVTSEVDLDADPRSRWNRDRRIVTPGKHVAPSLMRVRAASPATNASSMRVLIPSTSHATGAVWTATVSPSPTSRPSVVGHVELPLRVVRLEPGPAPARACRRGRRRSRS